MISEIISSKINAFVIVLFGGGKQPRSFQQFFDEVMIWGFQQPV